MKIMCKMTFGAMEKIKQNRRDKGQIRGGLILCRVSREYLTDQVTFELG